MLPLWLSWLVAIAVLGGVVFWLSYLYRHSWGLSWRAALVATLLMLAFEALILGVGRR